MNNLDQLVSIFCQIDDFCKELEQYAQHYFLSAPAKGKRGPCASLAVSEIMTLLLLFQLMHFRDFKAFYCGFVQLYWPAYFPKLPSYTRFVKQICEKYLLQDKQFKLQGEQYELQNTLQPM